MEFNKGIKNVMLGIASAAIAPFGVAQAFDDNESKFNRAIGGVIALGCAVITPFAFFVAMVKDDE